MENTRKLVLYISQSLDGYIAAPGDRLDFLSVVEEEGQDYGYFAFMESVDTVLIGRKTYDWVVAAVGSYPNAHLDTYVLTRSDRPDEGKVRFYSGDLGELLGRLKAEGGKDIYCDGGAEVVHLLLEAKLIDEMVISVIPVLLGDGVPLFRGGRPGQALRLLSSEAFPKGLVQLRYACLK